MCTERRCAPAPRRQAGLSLIEVIAFIVIVSVGLAGILSVLNLTLRHSADPIVQKQSLAIAESLLEEIQSKAFGWCDPDDSNAATATSAAGCANDAPAEAGRVSNTAPWDEVRDYAGYAMNSGIVSPVDGVSVISGLASYSASVSISNDGASFGLPADAVLRITVTASNAASGEPGVSLTGYRFRYAPN